MRPRTSSGRATIRATLRTRRAIAAASKLFPWAQQPPFDYTTGVYATDPATGIASNYVTFEISSNPVPLVIYPYYTVIREHTFDYLTALALDEQGAYRNATQHVIWSSADPSVADVTNDLDEASRVDGVAPGLTQIFATDPVSGAVSNAATFDVFGPLKRMDIYMHGRSILNTSETIDVGQTIGIHAWGVLRARVPLRGLRARDVHVEPCRRRHDRAATRLAVLHAAERPASPRDSRSRAGHDPHLRARRR